MSIVSRVAARYKKKLVSDEGQPIYQYSERQIALRNSKKAERLEKLRKSVHKLRSRVKKDLNSGDLESILTALVVGLMDHTAERVGNTDSAADGHFGVTGWKKKHVTFGKGKATIKYVGKSGVEQEKVVSDKSLVAALRKAYEGCKGEDIFCDDTVTVTASKVNAYLKKFDITAKDLRGLHANTVMQEELKSVRSKGGKLPSDAKERETQLKAEFKEALEAAAEAVGHEASTLRSQYLVPGLEDEYMKGRVMDKMVKSADTGGTAARHLVGRAVTVAGRVAARFIQAKASLAPAIRNLGKGELDLDAVKEALLALDVRPKGERWTIDADWYYGMGPRNQAKAKTIITSLGHLIGYPDDAVEVVTLKAIAHGLIWLEKAKGTTPAFQHGAFEITPLGVSGPNVKSALEALDDAAKAMRPKFPMLLYGKVFITKTLPNGHSAVAKYMEDGDVVYLSLKAKGTTGDVYALCHEFGHRYDRKFWKDKKQREAFNRLSTMPEYGQIVFDAALRKKLTDEFMATVEERKAGRQPAVSELLAQWVDHQMAHGLDKLRVLSRQAVSGDEQATRDLRGLMIGEKDVTVQTSEIVRKPLHVTTYGAKSPTENFAEAFAHLVLGKPMPAEIAAIMTAL